MKKFLLIFIAAFITIINAQAPDTAWTKSYHRGSYDECKWIEETSDSGFVMVGVSQITGNKWLDILLIRTDANGDTLWTHTYGDTIIGQEAFCVKEDYDGGFVIAAFKSLTMSIRNAWIIKTDNNGDTLWTMLYGGDRNAEALNISCTSDSGYIVTGMRYNPGKFADVFLLKINRNGDSEWSYYFGESSYEEGYSVQQTTDGGYIVAGSKNISGRSYDFYLIKTDSSGTVEWEKTYGGENYDHCTSAQQTSDGGYILFGETDSYVYNSSLAVKTNSLGDTLWTRIYNRSNGDYGWSVDQTSDDGFIFGGYTNNPGYRDDYWFVRTDANGDTLWMKSVGHGDDQRGYRVLQTADGGYVMAGYSPQGTPTFGDFYVVKLNAFVTDIEDRRNVLHTFMLYQNYPNPFNPTTTIEFKLPYADFVTLRIFNILGEEVETLAAEDLPAGVHLYNWNATGFASGVYFYKLTTDKGFVQSRKLILLK